MRKTSIAENWSAVEELRMVISRVGEERRTLEAQLGKVIILKVKDKCKVEGLNLPRNIT